MSLLCSSDQAHMDVFFWLTLKSSGSVTPPENFDVESLSGGTSSEDALVL